VLQAAAQLSDAARAVEGFSGDIEATQVSHDPTQTATDYRNIGNNVLRATAAAGDAVGVAAADLTKIVDPYLNKTAQGVIDYGAGRVQDSFADVLRGTVDTGFDPTSYAQATKYQNAAGPAVHYAAVELTDTADALRALASSAG
jgi:hypothetical protein